MVIEQLRIGTSAEHEALEKIMFPFLSSIKSPQDYCRLLRAFYGYIAPVQQLILQQLSAADVPELERRRNASLLLDDLRIHGDRSVPPEATDLPQIDSPAAAFGALYVMEGSTLGGKIIAKTIREQAGIDTGLNFFTGYGADTGTMWKSFLVSLENEDNQINEKILVETATSTFRLFGTWLNQQLFNNETN